MVITRSRSKLTAAETDGAKVDRQLTIDGEPSTTTAPPLPRSSSACERSPSPTSSAHSNTSATAAKLRRRMQLQIELEAAEREAEIERRLIAKRKELETQTLRDMEDDEVKSLHSNSHHSLRRLSDHSLRHACHFEHHLPNIQSEYNPPPPPPRPLSPPPPPSPPPPALHNHNPMKNDLNMFLARQTSAKDLPPYSGNPQEWPLFYSQFRTTTELCQFTDAENVARLCKSLSGRARDAVSSLLISGGNLDKIIKTLKLRFGRPEFIVEIMLNKIRSIKFIRHDDINGMIDFATQVQNVVETMKVTEEVGHISNPSLLRELISKLPSNFKYQWSFYTNDNLSHPDLFDFSEWLMTIANAAVHVAPLILPSTSTSSNSNSQTTPNKKPILSTTVPTCVFCKKDGHNLPECNSFKNMDVNERWKFVTDSKLCFSCLLSKHQIKTCKKKIRCSEQGCGRLHHQLLHSLPIQKDDPTDNANDSVINHVDTTTTPIIGHSKSSNSNVLLKVAPVVIKGPKGDIHTLALLDEGASISLATNAILERAGIDGPSAPLEIQGASGMTAMERNSKAVCFTIRGLYETDAYFINNVRTVSDLNISVSSLSFSKIVNKYPYVKDYVHDYDRSDKIELLIGQDNIDLIVTRQLIRGNKNGPFISKTRLGYVMHGNIWLGTIPSDATVLHLCACEKLNELIKDFYSTESFGTKCSTDTPRSREDKEALGIMERTTKLVSGNRWETGLLWKDADPQLPDSYGVARTRLDGVLRKMRRRPEFAARYRDKFQENLDKGYVSKLTNPSIKNSKTWYLPHFAVFNPNKPDKLRLVFDCAARSSGKCLNDFLYSGPDLLASLTGILLGFRIGRIAVMGDIQEMFHRVLVTQEDRQAQRILWEDGEYVVNVLTFGAVCSPSSSQYVKNINALRFQDTHPRAVKAIVEHHYVDDYILSLDTVAEAKKVTDDVISIHSLGGFNLRNCMSNSKEVLRHLPSDKLAPGGAKLLTDAKDQALERVLGVRWDPELDEFTFQLKLQKIPDDIKSGVTRPTKRDVLRLTMSVFDPLGFLLYIIVGARILLQDIWKSRIGWDDEIETSHFEKWRVWLSELRKVEDVRIPRWIETSHTCEYGQAELHIFADASSRAFAAVAYLRLQRPDGKWHIAFLMARARVAPLKILSVPRLELQAAIMAARLSQVLRKYVPLYSSTFFCTDSKTVLSWIRSESGRFKPFVAHRVSEIAELTEVRDWRWVSTHLNPADDATRDTIIENNSRWFSGPDFLRQSKIYWPSSETDIQVSHDDPEVKKNWLGVTTYRPSNSLFDCTRFSKFWRLVRCVAWLLRFLFNIKQTNGQRRSHDLTAQEIAAAEMVCIKESQARTFGADMHLLKLGKPLTTNSPLHQLTPFLDDNGVLRLAGRIDAANVNIETKRPIILHPKDQFTRLLMYQYHVDAAHIGRELVLNNLRKRYWIINGRNAVKSTWNNCQVCKNQRTKPTPALMGQLPPPRLTDRVRPFLFTGLDYFGPMTVKVGRRHEKRYGALFTCLTVRAVHIEIVSDLTTSSVIMALRRFIARRGCPQEIWCDNATNFKGADAELKRAVKNLDVGELLRFGSAKRVEWKFIPPAAPHMGGCWERLVRSVKVALAFTLKEKSPTDQTLMTLMAEAEFMVNSRPLTYVPIDKDDDLPLTPNDFLLHDTTNLDRPFASYEDGDLLRKGWRESQRLADVLWKRWVHEYLPSLTRRDKWFKSAEPLAVGDIVVVADNQVPRNQWLRGVVKQVYPGKDGQVRVADVMTGQTIYRRPVTKLCKLDVRSSS